MENELNIDEIGENLSVNRYRRWFQNAVDKMHPWREAAKEDYDFVSGKQWSESEIQTFLRQGRPAIVINKIKPLINLLSGYQRLNRYDIDFLPRTSDDIDLCKVRKGMTKYAMDTTEYDSEESQVFLDAAIGGLGWFDIGYKFDEAKKDGDLYIRREDPFGIYVDAEARKPDWSDAKYICRAKWVDKDELVDVYPEYADEINAQYRTYDRDENGGVARENIWYQRETKKVRLVECWYKENRNETYFALSDGTQLTEDQLKSNTDMGIQLFLTGQIEGYSQVAVTRVRVAVFMDSILLEDIDSPYTHGEFPFIPMFIYHYGEGDIPAGFVRDLKDPQREINKRRIQTLHILNTVGNGGGFIEEDAMTPSQFEDFEEHGNIPGHYIKIRPNAIGKIHERGMANPPAALIQAESQAGQDLVSISGINEALLGVDLPSSASGRAIELKQRQAVTHIAPAFDNLRKSKKRIAYLLWGRNGKPGVIPQFYTADKVYRIEGENGQQFIPVNHPIVQQDPLGNVIIQTINDLSIGDFDIVVADTTASATQRQSQMWGLVDAVQRLGVPGDLVFDIILDLSDIPEKNMLKQRYMERQQQQQQAQQAQAQSQFQLEVLKQQERNINQSISFKDAPFPIQLAMAANQGLIDPSIAQYAVQVWTSQLFPQLAMGAQSQQASPQLQQFAEEMAPQMREVQASQTPLGQAQSVLPPVSAPTQQPPPAKPMTEAAAKSIMSAALPAM